MALSVFDLFKIGIGPSSSHTVGPMRAALEFANGLKEAGLLERVHAVRANLYGSLGATGKGHGSDKAVLLGLEGDAPDTVDTEAVDSRLKAIREARRLKLLGMHEIEFREKEHLIMHRRESLPFHPNGMRFTAFDAEGAELRSKTYYSVGGGFVVNEEAAGADRIVEDQTPLPYPFKTSAELLRLCEENQFSISQLMWENEKSWRSEEETRAGLMRIWEVMQECVRAGISKQGIMPGGLKVRRRAADLHRKLINRPEASLRDPLTVMDWVNLYALAVNEQNATGGRVVTAPTNGAAGIIPAVLHYSRFVWSANDEGVRRFLLTAAAIGILYKENASISGAEVGCQGEVGVACSMAAGALAEVIGGTVPQVENAAEIGMEHNLGLTCDPVGGLVQVPCIERNAMGSIKAINAARMALRGDGKHFISLDKVIRTMRETGADMKTKYKETARGGLAVNIIEC
ncbi:MAG: L-serine ammonia-lyase [Candidatus Competibacter phosphatis]